MRSFNGWGSTKFVFMAAAGIQSKRKLGLLYNFEHL
jgi:hypothetical protein